MLLISPGLAHTGDGNASYDTAPSNVSPGRRGACSIQFKYPLCETALDFRLAGNKVLERVRALTQASISSLPLCWYLIYGSGARSVGVAACHTWLPLLTSDSRLFSSQHTGWSWSLPYGPGHRTNAAVIQQSPYRGILLSSYISNANLESVTSVSFICLLRDWYLQYKRPYPFPPQALRLA